jgi:hypothetical protein
MGKSKLLIIISMGLIFFSSGCVDTGVENISPQNYRSQVIFDNDTGTDATVSIDNSQIGSVQPGGESAAVEVPSGSRNITADFSAGNDLTQTISIETDFIVRLTMVEDSAGVRSFVKTLEGRK